MELTVSFYALSFYITFSLSLFLGLNVFIDNPKGKLNRLFAIMTTVLCFWAFGFAMSIIASDASTALFWRRISAIGRTMIHAFLLHMIFILTSFDSFLGKKRLALLYIPALISLYVFSISPTIAVQQYSFEYTSFGWTNITTNNFFYAYFHVYYSVYMIINFVLILKWRKKDVKNKVQANTLFKAFVATLVLGIISDLLLDIIFDSQTPHLGPMVALPPLITIFYLTKKSNLMQKKKDSEWDKILSRENKRKLYIAITYLFLGGGTINFYQYFLPQLMHSENSIQNVINTSAVFFIVGISILLIQLVKNIKVRDILVLITTLLSIPFITLSYLTTASITIWVIPIVFLIITLVFDSKIPITLTMVVGVLTQFVTWKFAPKIPVLMDEIDYFLRSAIIIVAYGMGLVVNTIYIKRLKENIYQTRFQRLISETSFSFLNAASGSFKENIDTFLRRIGVFLNVEKTYLCKFNKTEQTIEYFYEWNSVGSDISNHFDNLKLSFADFPWWLTQLEKKMPVYVEDTTNLSVEKTAELFKLHRKNFKSLIAVPIEEGNEVVGFVGCDTMAVKRTWNENEIGFLETIANMLGIILMKVRSEQEIEFLAYYDHLTGISNRTLFADRLTQAVQLAKRNNRLVAVILIDLDSFKMVNDTRGHSSGDVLLKMAASGLKRRLRKSDTVARFGGDEFLILANDLKDYDDVIKIVEKLTGLFKQPFELEGQNFYVTASMGIAVYPPDGEDAETLIKNADIAMYTSKARGKDQYTLCTAEMKDEIGKNLKISNNLYDIEKRKELCIHYQPQVKISTGHIVGLEALLRWEHPHMGLIEPNVFIPLAEVNGTINSIGTWVLKKSLKEGKKWHKNGFSALRIAVNLSIVQFNNPNFAEELSKILKEIDFNPHFLEIEITESVAGQEKKKVIETMDKLKQMGVSISIDDFGTDYSSFKRLQELPINRIKIDKQFVQGIGKNEKDSAIVNVIINLAKNLGIDVIAEGVETHEQLDFLKRHGCEEVQGFYFYGPMLPEKISQILIEKYKN